MEEEEAILEANQTPEKGRCPNQNLPRIGRKSEAHNFKLERIGGARFSPMIQPRKGICTD